MLAVVLWWDRCGKGRAGAGGSDSDTGMVCWWNSIGNMSSSVVVVALLKAFGAS